MKKLLFLLVALLIGLALSAQSDPIQVVFDVTSTDENTQRAALRHLKLMKDSYPDSEFELVIYGKALPMVLKEKSPFAEQFKELEGDERVAIKVCAMTMKRYEVDEDQLLSGVEPVPDAIFEIVKKQQQGWGYIKEAHH